MLAAQDINPLSQRLVEVGGREIWLGETADFPASDPWSQLTQEVIAQLAAERSFEGKDFFEAGIGDARNVIAARIHNAHETSEIIGVDLDDWRVNIAAYNLNAMGVSRSRLKLQNRDAVDWLEKTEEPLSGWAIACLPQAPGRAAKSGADSYQEDLPSLALFHDVPLNGKTADDYGLTLNTAFLHNLRKKIDESDFNALLTLSDRVPREVLEEMFDKTGWQIKTIYEAEEPVQQDPDTGVAWIGAIDDGERFWEKIDDNFSPISVIEAERRRLESLVSGDQAREVLNVYHGLAVFHIVPKV